MADSLRLCKFISSGVPWLDWVWNGGCIDYEIIEDEAEKLEFLTNVLEYWSFNIPPKSNCLPLVKAIDVIRDTFFNL